MLRQILYIQLAFSTALTNKGYWLIVRKRKSQETDKSLLIDTNSWSRISLRPDYSFNAKMIIASQNSVETVYSWNPIFGWAHVRHYGSYSVEWDNKEAVWSCEERTVDIGARRRTLTYEIYNADLSPLGKGSSTIFKLFWWRTVRHWDFYPSQPTLNYNSRNVSKSVNLS